MIGSSTNPFVENAVNPWFGKRGVKGGADLKLFCFPYAGGSSLVYRSWAKLLPENVQVIPVELPGRGSRLKESPFVSLPDLVVALTDAICPILDGPYAFFGHSMGAMIAFELARSVCRQLDSQPEVLFVSGRRAPQIPDTAQPSYNLPDEEFLSELKRIDGTPREVLEHSELMGLMMPLLRADFQVVQTYEYRPGVSLGCPISAFAGTADAEETRDLVSAWGEQTRSRFISHMIEGDHFFIRSSEGQLLQAIVGDLQDAVERRARR